jgi:hypothetical protein
LCADIICSPENVEKRATECATVVLSLSDNCCMILKKTAGTVGAREIFLTARYFFEISAQLLIGS